MQMSFLDPLDLLPDPKEESEGGEGEGGGVGVAGLDVEQLNAYFLAALIQKIREGEEQFGIVPLSEDPNLLLGEKAKTSGMGHNEISPHPLLSESQQFSGISDDLNIPSDENPRAAQNYELRLAQQLAYQRKKRIAPGR
jgi:hypothetical protein